MISPSGRDEERLAPPVLARFDAQSGDTPVTRIRSLEIDTGQY